MQFEIHEINTIFLLRNYYNITRQKMQEKSFDIKRQNRL